MINELHTWLATMDLEMASCVLKRPYTTQGWRPISAQHHPTRLAEIGATIEKTNSFK